MYESELTKFIKDFLKQHPEEVESQRKSRSIWWDKTPQERSPAPSMRHAPRAGGNEHTSRATGGADYTFDSDDNSNIKPKP